MRHLLACGLAFIVLPLAALAETQEVYRVTEAEARCLLANKAAYLEATTDPVVIFLAGCPTVDFSQAMRAASVNSVLPDAPVATARPEVDAVVIYSHAELSCLTLEKLRFEEGKAILPMEPECD